MCKLKRCPRCKNESLVESIKKREDKYAGLINIITSYAIENVMSLEEIDECMDHVRQVYYSDGVIRKWE